MAWLSHFTRAMHMQTAPFRRSLERAIELATQERVVLMCAEAVSWRCHRSLIADALLASRARSGSSADVNLIRVSLPSKTRLARTAVQKKTVWRRGTLDH